MVLKSFSCTQWEPTLTALHCYSKHGPKRPQKCRKTGKMTLFGPVFQISLVLKLIECHQSQHFYTLAKHIQKGYKTSNFQKKLSYMINFGFPRPSLAVIFIFTIITASTNGMRLPGDILSGTQLLFMSSKFFYLHHLIRRQNGPKPVKIQNFR